MRDPLDDTLADAGKFLNDTPDLDDSLTTLTNARAQDARATRRPARQRRPRLVPVLAFGAALAVVSGGAVAATQWGPWSYVSDEDTDLVVEREWADVDGNYLGACESRLSTSALPGDAHTLATEYLDSVDVDAIEPDPEWIAGLLHAVGRLDDVGKLVPGAVPDDFTAGGDGWEGPALEYFTDARVLQQALTQEVFNGMSDYLVERMPDFGYGWNDISARVETQCTTDPGRTGDQ